MLAVIGLPLVPKDASFEGGYGSWKSAGLSWAGAGKLLDFYVEVDLF